MKELILKQYSDSKTLYKGFLGKIVTLLGELIQQQGFKTLQITSRLKSIDSLSLKIEKKLGKYSEIGQITDILGIRIITYLESEVDKIAEFIGTEFLIDEDNSIDKRFSKGNQFGYRSLHVVISLGNNRNDLSEYKSFKNIKVEVQIRSVLQHAWAEIEHELGYKSKVAVPIKYVRSFNRLAALLELADIEFDRLKSELTTYESQVDQLITDKPEEVLIDQASVDAVNKSNEVLIQAKNIIANNTGAAFHEIKDFKGILERFTFFNISSIKDLEDILAKEAIEYLAFVNEFTIPLKINSLASISTLFYFQHYLAAKTENVKVINDYFTYAEPAINPYGDAALDFIEIYRQSKSH